MLETIDLGALLTCMRGTIDKLELEFAEIAVEFERTEGWAEDGYNTASDWIRLNCHMNSNQVWNSLAVGDHMTELSESVQAMKEGDVGYAHLPPWAGPPKRSARSLTKT